MDLPGPGFVRRAFCIQSIVTGATFLRERKAERDISFSGSISNLIPTPASSNLSLSALYIKLVRFSTFKWHEL